MKIKCNECSHMQKVTLDGLIFDNEDEEAFVTFLAAEFSKSKSEVEEI